MKKSNTYRIGIYVWILIQIIMGVIIMPSNFNLGKILILFSAVHLANFIVFCKTFREDLLDDCGIIHGEAAEEFQKEMKSRENGEISPEAKKTLEEADKIFNEVKFDENN